MAFNCSAPDTGNMEILAEHGTEEQTTLAAAAARRRDSQLLLDDRAGHLRLRPDQLARAPSLDGDEWVINGHKWFTSGYNGAAIAIAMVVTDPDAPPHKRASMILVPIDTPGFTGVRPVSVMGPTRAGPLGGALRGLPRARGQPPGRARRRLPRSRRTASAPAASTHCMRAIGSAERAFELMCKRAHHRESFGGKLAEKQFVQDFIAKSRMEIDQARLLVLHAAWRMDRGQARRAAGHLDDQGRGRADAPGVLDRAMQVHGALGMSDDTPLAAMWRQGRWLRIADGPDEVHKMVIALRELNRFKPREPVKA